MDRRKTKEKKGSEEKDLKIIGLGVFKRKKGKESNGNRRILFLFKHPPVFPMKIGIKWKENLTTLTTKSEISYLPFKYNSKT